MLSVIVAAIAGAIGALIAVAFAAQPIGVTVAGAAAFVVAIVLLGYWGRRSVRRLDPGLAPRFPSPKA
jgi:FtsH-binding integral membrane protein